MRLVSQLAYGTVLLDNKVYAVPADPAAVKQIATGSGGRTFTAEDVSQLKFYGYPSLKRTLSSRGAGTDVWHLPDSLGPLLLLGRVQL